MGRTSKPNVDRATNDRLTSNRNAALVKHVENVKKNPSTDKSHAIKRSAPGPRAFPMILTSKSLSAARRLNARRAARAKAEKLPALEYEL